MNDFPKVFAFVTCLIVITLALAQKCHAQNFQQDCLNNHNSARASVGVGNIQWNNTLATYAQNYANQRIGDCALVQSNGPYGENLVAGLSMTGTVAVQQWVSEQAYYDHDSNTCAIGYVCAHYTQVVWTNSGQLGCAKANCNNGKIFVVCNYSPRGNIVGQRPY